MKKKPSHIKKTNFQFPILIKMMIGRTGKLLTPKGVRFHEIGSFSYCITGRGEKKERNCLKFFGHNLK